jgi:2'-5' RNA ligase
VLRAFIAVSLAPPIIGRIDTAMRKLRASIPDVRWVKPENIHLTLKFLGNIEESQVDAIERVLAISLASFPLFIINARGLGVFPDARRPRVIWVGVDEPRLVELAASVEAALVDSGFAPEQRRFRPHLTIGRFRQFGSPANSLSAELKIWENEWFGACDIEQVTVFESVLRPGGAVHTALKTIPLADRQALV